MLIRFKITLKNKKEEKVNLIYETPRKGLSYAELWKKAVDHTITQLIIYYDKEWGIEKIEQIF